MQVKKIKEFENSLKSTNEETRRLTLQALQGMALPEIRELLFTAMGDDSWRVRKEAVERFVAARPDEASIAGLLELLRNDDNAGLRNSAAEAITRLDTRAADYLIRLTHDADADVRKFVIDVMGTIASPLFLSTLLSSLNDPDVNVASAAAEHLGHIGDAAAIPGLIRSIIANPSHFFRFNALVALGKLSSHMPVPQEIISLAEQDTLRKSVYECLGSIGDHNSAPILLQGFTSRHKSQRKAAITSWYRIFSRSSVTVRLSMEESFLCLKGDETLQTLIDSFDLGEPELAEAVTVLLGIVGDTRGAATLLTACTDERLAGSALSSFKRLGTEGVKVLIDLYPEYDETARAAICFIIGTLDYRGGSRIIINALNDEFPLVRKAAISAAGRLALTESIPLMVRLFEDQDCEVRSAVVSCLQILALHDREAVRQVALQLGTSENSSSRRDAAVLHATVGDHGNLALMVKDEDSNVRQTAVTHIGKLHLSSHMGLLRIALVDEDPDVRIAAAEAIGEIGGDDAVNALVHALGDEDCWVQCAVLKSLTRIDDIESFFAIQNLIHEASGLLMICCIEQLEVIGTQEALKLVESALDNDDDDIVSLAVTVLARQGGEWIVANAERLLTHASEMVRATWIGVLAGLPADDVFHILHAALKTEQSELVRIKIVNALENFP